MVHAMLQESAAFAQAASLDTHKALVHIFFAQRATKKVSQHVTINTRLCPLVTHKEGEGHLLALHLPLKVLHTCPVGDIGCNCHCMRRHCEVTSASPAPSGTYTAEEAQVSSADTAHKVC